MGSSTRRRRREQVVVENGSRKAKSSSSLLYLNLGLGVFWHPPVINHKAKGLLLLHNNICSEPLVGKSTGWEVSQKKVEKNISKLQFMEAPYHPQQKTHSSSSSFAGHFFFSATAAAACSVTYTHYYIMHSISTLICTSLSSHYTGINPYGRVTICPTKAATAQVM